MIFVTLDTVFIATKQHNNNKNVYFIGDITRYKEQNKLKNKFQ